MYVCQSPHKEALLHTCGEKHKVAIHGARIDGSPTYNRVWPGSPMGSLVTLHSLHQCYAAQSTIPSTLPWVDQSPFSHCVS